MVPGTRQRRGWSKARGGKGTATARRQWHDDGEARRCNDDGKGEKTMSRSTSPTKTKIGKGLVVDSPKLHGLGPNNMCHVHDGVDDLEILSKHGRVAAIPGLEDLGDDVKEQAFTPEV
ncbi:unnamed protein product [Cuscuta campestris]|uniref:Uncharacterized protein n=1 Tax=Cuscuta campestris TaxID=132261 RepID=A0A484M015_9ASTE|nr:unnamed protein product [Cuscuta campestris]